MTLFAMLFILTLYFRYCTRTLYRSQPEGYTTYRRLSNYYSYSCGFFGWSRCGGTSY